MKAYAKVNLYLKVIDKLENNFHNLEMLNTKIDFYDELFIDNASDLEHHVMMYNEKGPINIKDNLVEKAITELEKIRKITKVTIKIKKNIFIGGGLAGGSADAACAIKMLNTFLKLNLSEKEVKQICVNLGSDVYYCYNDYPAIVRGTGDSIENVFAVKYYILLVNNQITSHTKKVFEKLVIDNKTSKISDFYEAYRKKDIDKMDALFVNDLEKPALEVNPQLKVVKKNLMTVENFKLSGSGSTYYLLSNSYEYLLEIQHKLERFAYKTIITRTI